MGLQAEARSARLQFAKAGRADGAEDLMEAKYR